MEKRGLLFILCVSLSFFGVQTFFNWQNSSKQENQQQQLELRAQETKAKKAAEAAARRAPLSELPLSPFYIAQEGDLLGYGALSKNTLLVLAWDERLPASIYVPEIGSLQLATRSHKLGEPVMYSLGKTKPIPVPAIPHDFSCDLQFLTLSSEGPRVVVGEQKGDQLVLPFEPIESNALAFIKDFDHYVAVGIYDAASQRLRAFSDFERLSNLVQQQNAKDANRGPSNEQFYVLENEFQQLVFSTKGGALCEINLPFHSEKNPKSLVNEIDQDRQLIEQSPRNTQFPLFPASFAGENGVKDGSQGGYYPLLRRSQLDSSGSIVRPIGPEFYALNVVGEEAGLAGINYRMTRFEKNLIQFEGRAGSRRITKTFRIPQERNGPYCLELNIQVDGDAQGLYLTSGVPEAELMSGSFSPVLRYRTIQGKSSDIESIDLTDKKPVQTFALAPNWLSNSSGYFGIILDPLAQTAQGFRAAKIPGSLAATRLSLIDAAYALYPAEKYPGYTTSLPLQSGSQTLRIFAGPFDENLLKELDALYEDPIQGTNPEYTGAQSIQGWFSFISQPFSKFLALLMRFFYFVTGSWALSIVLLTVALRVMMLPLNNWSLRSTLKMQEIAPKVKAIQERNKKDPKRAQLEVMNLYREQGINPLSGCAPMLLQMPFLMGMFYLLKSSFPLRGASFIPGWIDNLATPDVVFTWDYPIPLIGTEFHLLPILIGLAMFLQQKMTAKTPKDEKDLSDAQKQQKLMANMMSILFIVMFYSWPSGLNIYFLFSTLLGMLQQWWINRKTAAAPTLILKKK